MVEDHDDVHDRLVDGCSNKNLSETRQTDFVLKIEKEDLSEFIFVASEVERCFTFFIRL